VIEVDPATGTQTPVTVGGLITQPFTIAQGADGFLYVQNPANMIRINACTGAQSLFSTNISLVIGNATALLAHSNGDMYYTSGSKITRVNGVTGAQSVLSSGGVFLGLHGLTEGPDHMIYAADFNVGSQVLRVDPVSGAQTVVAGPLTAAKPQGIAFDSRDSLYVLAVNDKRVYRVSGGTSGPLTASDGTTVFWMTNNPDGNLYYTRQVPGVGQVARVNTITGSVTSCTSGGLLVSTALAITTAHRECVVPTLHSTWGQVKTAYR
jgi:streptogramin lyase